MSKRDVLFDSELMGKPVSEVTLKDLSELMVRIMELDYSEQKLPANEKNRLLGILESIISFRGRPIGELHVEGFGELMKEKGVC